MPKWIRPQITNLPANLPEHLTPLFLAALNTSQQWNNNQSQRARRKLYSQGPDSPAPATTTMRAIVFDVLALNELAAPTDRLTDDDLAEIIRMLFPKLEYAQQTTKRVYISRFRTLYNRNITYGAATAEHLNPIPALTKGYYQKSLAKFAPPQQTDDVPISYKYERYLRHTTPNRNKDNKTINPYTQKTYTPNPPYQIPILYRCNPRGLPIEQIDPPPNQIIALTRRNPKCHWKPEILTPEPQALSTTALTPETQKNAVTQRSTTPKATLRPLPPHKAAITTPAPAKTDPALGIRFSPEKPARAPLAPLAPQDDFHDEHGNPIDPDDLPTHLRDRYRNSLKPSERKAKYRAIVTSNASDKKPAINDKNATKAALPDTGNNPQKQENPQIPPKTDEKQL